MLGELKLLKNIKKKKMMNIEGDRKKRQKEKGKSNERRIAVNKNM